MRSFKITFVFGFFLAASIGSASAEITSENSKHLAIQMTTLKYKKRHAINATHHMIA